jgi:hypothetical protein
MCYTYEHYDYVSLSGSTTGYQNVGTTLKQLGLNV